MFKEGLTIFFQKYKGTRIRASDRSLVVRSLGGRLVCLFLAVVLHLNIKKLLDTDWNTDLKEKRLAYGVSQNKLAVAAGITRQYFGKIESGSVAPSEEIKENLLQALERYNP